MAYKLTALFLLTLFLISTTTPLAHGVLINGQKLFGLNIHGSVFCSTTGNPPGPGIAGINVRISCNGGKTSLAQVLTDANGFFQVVLTALDGILFDLNSTPCEVFVDTPVANCGVDLPKGVLRAPISIVGNLIQTLLGLIADTTCGPFQYIKI